MPLYRRSETTAGTYLLEPRRTVVTGAGLFHTVIRAVSAQNISRHANAHYRPASSDRVGDHRMRHLLRHARHRLLCPLADRTVIQAKRRLSAAGRSNALSHVTEDVIGQRESAFSI